MVCEELVSCVDSSKGESESKDSRQDIIRKELVHCLHLHEATLYRLLKFLSIFKINNMLIFSSTSCQIFSPYLFDII